MIPEIKIGDMIIDDGQVGVIINEIKSGTWTEEPLFNWTTSYEIKYLDGTVCIMTQSSISRLIEKGKITVLGSKNEQ